MRRVDAPATDWFFRAIYAIRYRVTALQTVFWGTPGCLLAPCLPKAHRLGGPVRVVYREPLWKGCGSKETQ